MGSSADSRLNGNYLESGDLNVKRILGIPGYLILEIKGTDPIKIVVQGHFGCCKIKTGDSGF